MVFGRKKNKDEDALEADPELGDGVEVEPVTDDFSLTDSIPPPPPNGDMVEEKNEGDSSTLEDAASTEPKDDANGSLDDEKEAESIKRKKLILIAACIVSFFTLLGLAVSYGKKRKQSKNNAVAAVVGTDSPVFTSTATPTVATTENLVPDTAEVPPEFTPTADTAAPDVVDEEPDQGTSAPSDGTSSSGTLSGFEECTANEISVLTTCNENGAASANLSFCLVDEMNDQFWAFVSTPPLIPLAIQNDWAWMADGPVGYLPFLPEGTYEIGLFSNGSEIMEEYPLITSTEFVVSCDE